MTNKLEQLEQQVLVGKALGLMTATALVELAVAHIAMIGGDQETALRQTIAIVQKTIDDFRITVKTTKGDAASAISDIREREQLILSGFEADVRRRIGLPQN
ncbi:MAG: hypothetical protein HZA68_04885 [Rhodovulum sp.]|uniref:hypothetical protein n=1 Tax=Rhodoplanes TaxID=29407 RepID=UPI00101CBF4B|nr:hypothetical protein [Rhodoplanes serenus]MBI5111295.1 hypothetical protein [Rhodovulum sp.]